MSGRGPENRSIFERLFFRKKTPTNLPGAPLEATKGSAECRSRQSEAPDRLRRDFGRSRAWIQETPSTPVGYGEFACLRDIPPTPEITRDTRLPVPCMRPAWQAGRQAPRQAGQMPPNWCGNPEHRNSTRTNGCSRKTRWFVEEHGEESC